MAEGQKLPVASDQRPWLGFEQSLSLAIVHVNDLGLEAELPWLGLPCFDWPTNTGVSSANMDCGLNLLVQPAACSSFHPGHKGQSME